MVSALQYGKYAEHVPIGAWNIRSVRALGGQQRGDAMLPGERYRKLGEACLAQAVMMADSAARATVLMIAQAYMRLAASKPPRKTTVRSKASLPALDLSQLSSRHKAHRFRTTQPCRTKAMLISPQGVSLNTDGGDIARTQACHCP